LHRGLERRLARAEAGAERIAALRDAGREQEEAARLRDTIAAAIRAGLIAAGLDPEEAACLRRHNESMSAPPPPPPPSPEDDPIEWLEAKFARYAECAREDPPDLAEASMAELFAVYGMTGEDAGAPATISPSPPIGGRGPG